MAEKVNKAKVKGGYVSRSAQSGRFVSVQTSNGVKKRSQASAAVVQGASIKRQDALKRLVNR